MATGPILIQIWNTTLSNTDMRFAIRYICIFASLLICCSCDLEELKLNNPSESTIDFIARPADYSNVYVTTKSAPTDAFETEIHTAYLLLFDANNNRIYFSEVDPQSRLQRVTLKGLSTVTACFVANVAKADIEGITTLDALNSDVLNLNYATYSEAGGHLGVPKLAVNGTYQLCFPMVGVKTLDVSQISQAIEIPLTRLFAKVSVELKMNISNISDATRFELHSYKLVNLPLKVRLLPQNAESAWVKHGGSFAGENSHVASNINHKIYNDSYRIASEDQKKYSFDLYVPEYQLESLPSNTAKYGEPEYKPIMYDQSKKAVHVVLSGSYIPREGSSSDLDYSVFLGEDESTNFTLNRNTHYNNYLTIQGITKKADNTEEALVDHRVKKSEGDMVSMFGEVANCYIISKEGKYSFPAYKGAFKADQLSKEYLCNGNRAEIIYRSNTTDIVFEDEDDDGNLINVTTDIDGTKVIGFKLSKVNAEDNVIIAIYDSNGNIEWSWHLWFVTGLSVELLGDKYFQMSTQTMPNANGQEMIDRNLGVITSGLESLVPGTFSGSYYKYGHKEPYLDNKYQGGGECDKYDWSGDKKSRTDPCPPGYRVPASSVWSTNVGSSHASLVNAFLYWDGDSDIYYPYSNYLLSDGSLNQNTTEYMPFQEGYSFESTGVQGTAPLSLGILGTRYVRALAVDKFTIVDMDIQASKEEGRLWSANGYFNYTHNTLDLGEIFNGGVDALREKLHINEYTHERKVVKEYKIKASLSELRKILNMITSGNITDAFLESIAVWGEFEPVDPPQMTESDKNALLGRLILLDSESIDQARGQIITEGINKAEGYQVRCVKE